ncbi:MAG: TnpV protein [Oscillospiraceae bacterium]|nr:TnpV protein [Oscillospiraceae bacterium]
MDITYTKCGDCYLSDIALSDTTHYHIGKYGRMRRVFLQEHRPIQYNNLVLTEKLFPHLAEFDDACHQRLEVMIPATAELEGVTAALKRADQMEWVRRMNSIKARAEEIILAELVHAD